MSSSSRRVFLQQATSAAAALLCGSNLASWGQSPSLSGRPRAWRTASQERFSAIPVAPWQTAKGPATGKNVVEIDPSQRFQSILGFGAAFTDASCYLLSRMEPAQRQQLLEEFFGPRGLRLSMGRTCIGSSDYSRSAYSYDDTPEPDPQLKQFSVAHDRAYMLPVMREALGINPEIFFFSTPWSPPGWMKAGGSLLGGSMRKHYFASYAQYFVKFLQAYQAEGVRVQAVTSQNEVDTDQDGRMPAALWGQEYEVDFVKGFLAPALRKAGLDTKIWILDHNYDLWGRVMDELSDPGVFAAVDGVAWHGYEGSPNAMTRVHNAFPTKNAYWTEGGPLLSDPDYVTGWARWSATYAGILKNWARCIVGWNLLLDENGQPNIGPFDCGGMITLNSRTGQLTRSGQYWAFAHYAKAVRRGAKVIASQTEMAGMEHAAFLNPAGDYVLVLANQGAERAVECRFQGQSLQVQLPRNSVVTLQWS